MYREDKTNIMMSFESVGVTKLICAATSNGEIQPFFCTSKRIMTNSKASGNVRNKAGLFCEWKNIDAMQIELATGGKVAVSGIDLWSS